MRSVRDDAVERSRRGNLASVFDDPDDFEKCIYVVKLLDVHPQLGKVAGRKLLSSLGISQFDCVGDISEQSKALILQQVGEDNG